MEREAVSVETEAEGYNHHLGQAVMEVVSAVTEVAVMGVAAVGAWEVVTAEAAAVTARVEAARVMMREAAETGAVARAVEVQVGVNGVKVSMVAPVAGGLVQTPATTVEASTVMEGRVVVVKDLAVGDSVMVLMGLAVAARVMEEVAQEVASLVWVAGRREAEGRATWAVASQVADNKEVA